MRTLWRHVPSGTKSRTGRASVARRGGALSVGWRSTQRASSRTSDAKSSGRSRTPQSASSASSNVRTATRPVLLLCRHSRTCGTKTRRARASILGQVAQRQSGRCKRHLGHRGSSRWRDTRATRAHLRLERQPMPQNRNAISPPSPTKVLRTSAGPRKPWCSVASSR